MKLALVAIGRRENRYAREFVEHYLALGFSHVFILDNNHEGEERFEDVLGDFLASGQVSIHDYRDREGIQAKAYNETYRLYGADYDWMAFFDFDELLVMTGSLTLRQWLSRQKKATEMVKVNWMMMTDSGLLEDDGRPMMERFTEVMEPDKAVQYRFPENNHVKSIVRGGLSKVRFKNPHVPITPGCPAPKPFRPYDYSVCCLRHYSTKTISEWLSNKCQKGVGDRRKTAFDVRYRDRFFQINEHTSEKQAVIDGFMSRSMIDVAVVHYNTPKLTRAAILSLWKHTPCCRVTVFDNSDRLPISRCPQWDDIRQSPLIRIIDNTEGQVIDFAEMLSRYPDREDSDRNRSNYGSAKHTASVDKLFRLLPEGFLLMDSDVLFTRDIMPLIDREVSAVGMLRPNAGVMRLLPLLCWINVPMLQKHGIRYFNGEKMWALSGRYPDNRYDTGAWLLEEIRRCRLPLTECDIRQYVIHLGHASWKDQKPMSWARAHSDLWM